MEALKPWLLDLQCVRPERLGENSYLSTTTAGDNAALPEIGDEVSGGRGRESKKLSPRK